MTVQTAPSTTLPERPILISFALFVIVSGGASVAIRFTYAELAPFWAATSRFAIAAVIFWGLVVIRKIPLPRGRALLGAVLFGTLTVGLAFLLIGWGLVETPASLYQILMAMVPLITLFLSALHGVERITVRGLLGSVLAVIGIVVTVGGAQGTSISLPHIGAIIVAAVFLSEGGVLIKKFPPNPPIMTNAIGMTAGTIVLGSASLLTGEEWTIPVRANTWIAFVYLVFIVTTLAFMLYMYMLGKWTASGTSYGFVIIPLITMVIASSLAGEQITLNFIVGAALVLGGVLIGALIPSKTRPAPQEACKQRAGQVLPHCG